MASRRSLSHGSDHRAAGRTDEKSSMCRRCESIKSSPHSSKHFNDTLVSFNSRTSVFQTDDEGAIPSTRSRHERRFAIVSTRGPEVPTIKSRFSERNVVCKSTWEGLTPSRLSTANAVRITWNASSQLLVAADSDHDGLVTLGSLIRSPHCVRFTGDPRAARDMRARAADARGAGRLVTTPARQAGPGRCDPCAPHEFF